MTLSDFDALIASKPLPPERIYGWLDTQMSIARFYGGLTYQEHGYTIALNEDRQPLVRNDVLQRETKERKAAIKAAKIEAKEQSEKAQGELL